MRLNSKSMNKRKWKNNIKIQQRKNREHEMKRILNARKKSIQRMRDTEFWSMNKKIRKTNDLEI